MEMRFFFVENSFHQIDKRLCLALEKKYHLFSC